MKKLATIVMAIFLATTLAAPVMAETTVDFSGYYRVQGWMYGGGITIDDRNENVDAEGDDGDNLTDLHNDEGHSYMTHRFNLNATFNANENVKVVTNFRGYDGNFPDTSVDNDDTDIEEAAVEMHTAYMQFITGIGMFRIGTLSMGKFGNEFGNDGNNQAAIQYLTKLGNFGFSATYVKGMEADHEDDQPAWIDGGDDGFDQTGDGQADGASDDNIYNDDNEAVEDQDLDAYGIAMNYETEMINTGIAYGYSRNATKSTDTDFNTQAILNFLEANHDGSDDYEEFIAASMVHGHAIDVYFNLTLGNLFLGSELVYQFGEVDWHDNRLPDADISAWGFGLDASYNFGMATVKGGWYWAQGLDWDDDYEEIAEEYAMNNTEFDGDDEFLINAIGNTFTAFGYTSGGIGDAAGSLYLLGGGDDQGYFSIQQGDNQDLGDVAKEVAKAGQSMIFLGVDVKPLENLSLDFAVGTAWTTADRENPYDEMDNDFDSGTSYGWEFDMGLTWQIMDAVTYSAKFAYLDLGDAWDSINREILDTDKWTDIGGAADGTHYDSDNYDAPDNHYVLTHEIKVSF